MIGRSGAFVGEGELFLPITGATGSLVKLENEASTKESRVKD